MSNPVMTYEPADKAAEYDPKPLCEYAPPEWAKEDHALECPLFGYVEDATWADRSPSEEGLW